MAMHAIQKQVTHYTLSCDLCGVTRSDSHMTEGAAKEDAHSRDAYVFTIGSRVVCFCKDCGDSLRACFTT